MAAFAFRAIDASGRQKKGVLEADSVRQIRQQLREKGMMPLDVTPVVAQSESSGKISVKRLSISTLDLALVTRQLAVLVQSALPLEESIKTIADQSEKAKVKSMLMAIRAKVLEGHSLAESLAEFPHAFPAIYRATVAAGEHTGHLDTVLEQLANYLEKSFAAKQKIQSALIYPSVLVVFSIGILAFLLTVVVPKIVDVFAQSEHELPVLTRLLINVSDFFKHDGWMVLLAFAILFIANMLALQNPRSRLVLHRLRLKLFLFGKLTKGVNVSRFATTLSILQTSGVPLVEALKMANQVITNEQIKADLEIAAQRVREGAGLYQALEQTKHFPPMMLHMIRSGESGGELGKMLDRAALTQQMRLDATITTILGLFEPFMLIFMGGAVLVIVLAIMLPIMQLSQIATQ